MNKETRLLRGDEPVRMQFGLMPEERSPRSMAP